MVLTFVSPPESQMGSASIAAYIGVFIFGRFYMLKAFAKFLLFIVPLFILNGLMYIFFENKNIADFTFYVTKRKNPKNLKIRVLQQYIEKCYKQVNEKNDR